MPAYPAGSPDPWNVGDELIVGDSANGTLSIGGGSDVTSSGATQGFNPLVSGKVTVTGTGSTWVSTQNVLLGVFGTGELEVLAGGQVDSPTALLGQSSGVGKALVSGSGSQWINSQTLIVGNGGTGELTIQQQGRVRSKISVIGLNDASHGSVVIDGQLSTWEVADTLSVGAIPTGGTATLSLTGAGSRLYVGDAAVSHATAVPVGNTAVIVSDTGSPAELKVYDGNSVQNSGSAYIGYAVGESGSVLINGAASTWNNAGDVVVGLAGSGTLTLVDGATVNAGGTVSVGAEGLLIGRGTVDGSLSNSGRVAPGQSIGALTVNGGYQQMAAGKLQVELSGSTAGQFDTLGSSGLATLTGTLDVDLGLVGGNPYEPQMGNTYQLVTASSGVSGQFTSAELPTLATGRMWQVRYSVNAVTLAVTLAGDYNDNGIVDAADYTVWRNLFGAVNDPRADGDTNGVVNVADFNVWKANFGLSAGAGAVVLAANVPEPTTLAYVTVLLALLANSPRTLRR